MRDLDPYKLLRRWLMEPDTEFVDRQLVADTRQAVEQADTITDLTSRPLPGQARLFDPESSHQTVRNITTDVTLQAMILDVAGMMDVFDDGDLTDQIRRRYGVTPDRNIVARARGRLERSAAVVRVGARQRPDRTVSTIHFQHWSRT